MFIEVFGWIMMGLITGYVASSQMNRHGEGLVLDLGLGAAGAMAGGWLFKVFSGSSVTGLSLWSAMVAVLGAVIVLVIGRIIRRPAFHG
jgi:uncharacterized membrane protein YeaQ/YmgE (transglycosylase-associated protein family)